MSFSCSRLWKSRIMLPYLSMTPSTFVQITYVSVHKPANRSPTTSLLFASAKYLKREEFKPSWVFATTACDEKVLSNCFFNLWIFFLVNVWPVRVSATTNKPILAKDSCQASIRGLNPLNAASDFDRSCPQLSLFASILPSLTAPEVTTTRPACSCFKSND